MRHLQGPWYEGRRAYHHGLDKSSCPYIEDGQEKELWLNGWSEEDFYGGWQGHDLYETVTDTSLVMMVNPESILQHSQVVLVPIDPKYLIL